MLEILDTASKPFVFCWISDFTELKIQRCHVVNKTGTLPHGISGAAISTRLESSLNECHSNFLKICARIPDTVNHLCFVKFLTSQKWRLLDCLFSFMEFLKVQNWTWNKQFLAMCWSIRTATQETPCGKVPVLFTTWHLWIFSSVKSEIQQNTNGLLTVSRISSTIFRMATFVHSFDLNYVWTSNVLDVSQSHPLCRMQTGPCF